MDPQFYKILVFAVWFILPIIPAYILYRFLPNNQVAVSGPFKGFKVDMAGSFAGYFVLFIGSYFIVKKMIFEEPVVKTIIVYKDKPSDYEVWNMVGTVFDEKNEPLDEKDCRPNITLLPSNISFTQGSFSIKVPVEVKDSFYKFQGISINAFSKDDPRHKLRLSNDLIKELYSPSVIKGDRNGKWKYDFSNKIIKYDTSITLIKEN